MSGVRVPPRSFLILDPQHRIGVQMFTHLETRTLLARSLTLLQYRTRDLRALTALAALIAAPISGASAQRRPPEPPPRVMIATLASTDKDLGQQAAEALRSRISRDINNQKLTVIPKSDIENTLKASGYSTTESLQ